MTDTMQAMPSDPAQLCLDALAWGICGDSEKAAEAVSQLVAVGGTQAAYSAMCAWSDAALQPFRDDPANTAGDFWGFQVATLDGRTINIDTAGLAPHEKAALQFIVCYGNDDHDTCKAILNTAGTLGYNAKLLVEILALAIPGGRYLVEKQRETGA